MSHEQKTYQDESGESDEARANRQAQQKREWQAANTEQAKAQRIMDFHWQTRRDAEAALRDALEWDDGSGFLERKRPSCHRSRKDSDWNFR
jgi:hypothetical protein